MTSAHLQFHKFIQTKTYVRDTFPNDIYSFPNEVFDRPGPEYRRILLYENCSSEHADVPQTNADNAVFKY